MARPLLVVVGYVWPEPNSSAAGSRILSIIHFFRLQHWRIIFASAAAYSEHKFDLSTLDIAEASIELNNPSFDEWIKQQNPTAVLFDRFFTEEQFGWRVEINCPQALRLLDTEDFHGLRNCRHQILKKNLQTKNTESEFDLGVVQAAPQELFEHMMDDESVQRELAAIYRCDLSFMVSSFEMELLVQQFKIPETQLFYLPLLVDSMPVESMLIESLPAQSQQIEFNAKSAQQTFPDFFQRENFSVIGNFRHEPNWDSVLLLKEIIWPALQKKLRALHISAELHIYGAYPPPKATQLHNARDGFLIKGWAADAHKALAESRVCLAPLRFGAGQKGKLLSAMQAGTPSVTTSIGVEGMLNKDAASYLNWSGAVADDVHHFVDAAVELYTQQEKWKAAQSRGFELINENFTAKNYTEKFSQTIAEYLNNLSNLRKNNVVGVLLRQQQHRATQYMGQWIQEKNKLKL